MLRKALGIRMTDFEYSLVLPIVQDDIRFRRKMNMKTTMNDIKKIVSIVLIAVNAIRPTSINIANLRG